MTFGLDNYFIDDLDGKTDDETADSLDQDHNAVRETPSMMGVKKLFDQTDKNWKRWPTDLLQTPHYLDT